MNKEKMKDKARKILQTWSKETLISALIDDMTSSEMVEFVKQNSEN